MLTQLRAFTPVGVQAVPVDVEIGVVPTASDAKFLIVGLGDTAVQESKQRVMMAIKSSGYRMPMGRSTTVNLAPAHLRKAGSRFDLPIAIGMLASADIVDIHSRSTQNMAFVGELAFDGSLRHCNGVLAVAMACRSHGIQRLMVPLVNAAEAALVPEVEVVAVTSLQEAIAYLRGAFLPPEIPAPASAMTTDAPIDFSAVRGQAMAKRALEIAAAGGHNVLLSGAPGSGKTLLASALRGILPPLTREEALEVTSIYSIANLLPAQHSLISERPIRTVHHTASGVAIVGGGQHPMPGEISLAHRGVLFLDELGEFPPQVLEVLRQPMEERTMTINRAQGSVTFPADFMLIAAMNPPKYSTANPDRLRRRISQPLLDRIDLTIDMQPVDIDDLRGPRDAAAETSDAIRARVLAARERQSRRLKGTGMSTNKEMGVEDIERFCPLDSESETLLSMAAKRLSLSARGYHRTIKAARTIADLAGEDAIQPDHIAEALQYRLQPVYEAVR